MEDDLKNPNIGLPVELGRTERPHDYESARKTKRLVGGSEREAMFCRLQEIVLDGLRHGFFDCLITCELVKEHKRRVVIKAGKSYQFTICEEDLQT